LSAIGRATGREEYRVAVALGSGLSDVAASLLDGAPIPYSAIEGMPISGVEGHEGALYHGEIEGNPALVFAGRVHLYEGHDAAVVTHWVRAAVEAGCDTIVLTNAAGGLRLDQEVGAPCLISDHINLTGTNPLLGPNDDSVGPRFLDQSEVYDPGLRAKAKAIDPDLGDGVYAGLLGPTYETPAEVRMLATVGADLVGMSTVLEAIQARYLGARVLAISVVTNRAAGLGPPLSHDEVAEAGRKAAGRLENILRQVIASL
jgi:purine-nucleoside phosphorylase